MTSLSLSFLRLLHLQDEGTAFSFTVHFTQRFGETAFSY